MQGTDFRRDGVCATAVAVLQTLALIALGAMGTPLANAQAQMQNRITAPIRSDQMQVIRGTLHPMVAVAQDQGSLSGSTTIQGITLAFRRSPAQEADLKNLLQEQQTKGSPMYHRWLQPGQFAARYGVSQQDLAKVAAWLKLQGFTVTAIPPSADRIVFSGTAAQVNAAFQTEMHRYLLDGRSNWANSTPISVPQAIAGMVARVGHLNTFRPAPHVVKLPVHVVHNAATSSHPNYTLCTSSQSPCPSSDVVNFIAPSDSQTIYDVNGLYNNSITGTGQTMAIVGQTDIVKYQNDIKTFRTLSGLNGGNLPTQVVVPTTGSAAVSVPDLEEADIDVEWAGAIAKDASILYVTVGNNQNYSVFNALEYAIQIPLLNGGKQFVPVISMSYGGCEKYIATAVEIQSMEQVLEQANAQGQTVLAASGDSGSADCDISGQNNNKTFVGATQGLAVDYPPSSQYVTAVGGTSFSGDLSDPSNYWSQSNSTDNGSALGYIPETTWNNTPTLAALKSNGVLSASGGGASALFTKPSWQVGSGVPADNKRDVPDVSLAADPNHDGYVLCTEETNNAGTQLTGESSCVYPVSGTEVPYFDANETGYLYGGTSIAAPQMAAMITLWNQEAGNANGVGNANPIFYLNAKNTPAAFHDVTTGSNAVVCEAGSPNCVSSGSGYVMSCCNAGSGYDEATGLGSVDATAMGAAWPRLTAVNPSFSLLLNPSAVSVNPGNSATTTLVLSPAGGFTGTVNLACSNLPTGVTCSFSPASVTFNSSGQQTVTVTVSATSAAAATSMVRRSSPPLRDGWPLQTAFAGLLGLFLFGAGRKRRFFPSRWMTVLLLAGGLMAATALTACGSGGPSSNSSTGGNSGGTTPTPVTQSVTVTGTSGSTTASAAIQLTIT